MGMTTSIHSVLEKFDKADLSLIPTSLYRLENLSRNLGCNIYCKRDDLTGFAFGGNKTRKLDYIIRDALNSGADSIVTFGSNQSNWCRMTTAAGTVNGLDVHLVLAGTKPDKPTANLLLDHLSGANIEHIDTEDEEILIKATLKKADLIRREGRKPYYVAVGGSNAIGSLGYLRAFAEILDYSERNTINFSRIFVASGSAGTQAGLVAGKIISGWSGTVVGIAVSRESNEQSGNVYQVTHDTLELTGTAATEEMINSSIKVDDRYLGEGYRRNTDGCLEAIRLFAQTEGIFLDEVYTGKAAAGLIDYARLGRFEPGENILFIHTGGNVQLFE